MAACECGCGADAGVYATSNSAEGIVAGQPKRFIHGHRARLQERRPPRLEDRYTVEPSGCWVWKVVSPGCDGYGVVWVDGRKVKAHRHVYEVHRGPLPDGCHLDHACRNRACVNPAHLRPMSHADNCRIGLRAKLTMEKATEIRTRLADGAKGLELAREYGVTPQTISAIKNGHVWV